MIKEENHRKYFNNLRIILRSKLETLDYYEQTIRLQELQKRANVKVFLKTPIFYFLRSILYLPTYILKYFDKMLDKFYLIKLRSEVDILRIEIKQIQKQRWIRLPK
tara:strand:+ start:424 stop:741 length:318 start_codon:yes stop_codon:yes gene_type:complete